MAARESVVGIGRILFSSSVDPPVPQRGPKRFSLSQWPLGLFPRPYVMLQRNRSGLVHILRAGPAQAHPFQIPCQQHDKLTFFATLPVISDGLWALAVSRI